MLFSIEATKSGRLSFPIVNNKEKITKQVTKKKFTSRNCVYDILIVVRTTSTQNIYQKSQCNYLINMPSAFQN
jgi:hypothetical protein